MNGGSRKMDLKKYVANVPDFPIPGIQFKDVTPIMQSPEAFSYAVDLLAADANLKEAQVICAPEARGFIFGCPVSIQNNLGFVPVRKPKKLPREVVSEEYSLEYGTNTLCMHKDAIKNGQRVYIIDDLLATGGTILACCKLVERLGGIVAGIGFVIELQDLKGREVLKDYNVYSLIKY